MSWAISWTTLRDTVSNIYINCIMYWLIYEEIEWCCFLQSLMLWTELAVEWEETEVRYHVCHWKFHVWIESRRCFGMPSTHQNPPFMCLLGELLMDHRMIVILLISNKWLSFNSLFMYAPCIYPNKIQINCSKNSFQNSQSSISYLLDFLSC